MEVEAVERPDGRANQGCSNEREHTGGRESQSGGELPVSD
jgi:hypothetical protein